jgi:hypothetical protein
MIKKRSIVIIILIIFGATGHIGNSFGHGLGLDTIKSADVNGKKIIITAQITPTDFSQNVEKKIIISAVDSQTNQSVSNVTFLVSLSYEGNLVFKDSFFADNGMVSIQVKPTAGSEIQLRGERYMKTGVMYETETKPIELVGPVFSSGGLYHFEIEIKTIDEPTNIIKDSKIYVADVTMTTNQVYEEKDKNGNDVKFGIKSYYDKISSFDYDPNKDRVHFEMPFDWSEQNISHIPVVHEEVHFPKEFGDFFVPSYVGKVNGIELFKSSVTIDDYSSEGERIIHLVLSQDNLNFLKQAQKTAGNENPQNMQFTLEVSNKVVFPVIAMTKNEEIQVDLSWEPLIIEPNKDTKFIYTFRNAKTGEPLRNTIYDFVILQGGKEIYKKSANAQIGGDFADYTFLEGQTGHTTIRFENIRGADLSTEFGITIVPEFGPIVFIILPVAVAAALIIGNNKFRA